MGWLNSEKAPEKWSPAFFKMFVERLRTALNNIDESNLPDGLSGGLIKAHTVSTGALANFSHEHSIFAQATPYTTVSITAVVVGTLIQWTPSNWGTGNVKIMLEVIGGVSNATATATFELWGSVSGKLATVTTQAVSLGLLRSSVISPPGQSENLFLKAYTSNATYSAQALSAKVIIVPSY